jgi:hypothetical protein
VRVSTAVAVCGDRRQNPRVAALQFLPMPTFVSMTTRRASVVFAALTACLLVLAACGSEEPTMDYEGTYEVIQHTRNTSGCDGGGTGVDGGDSYFKLEERGGRLAYFACSSATECEDIANDTRSLQQQDGDVWLKTVPSADETGSTCELQVVERRAEPAQNGIRLTRQKYSASYDTPDFECTESAAADRRDELECTETESLIAVPVE